jgi:replicative DNA helicase
MSLPDLPLPNCVETERVMLGSIILNNLLIEQARRDCPAEWLYSPSHRRVFAVMLTLHDRKEDLSSTLIAEELKRDSSLESCGGMSFLSNLSYGLPHVATLNNYIARIRESARRRWLIKFAEKVQADAFDGEVSDDDLFTYAIGQLDSVRVEGQGKSLPSTLENLGDDQLLRYENFFRGISDALPTGIPEIDEKLFGGGLVQPGFYVLAAPTSMGKSSLALDISANIAETGHRVYIVSREMSRESLFDRLVAVESGVERWKINPGIYESSYKKIQQAVLRLAAKPIILDDTSITVSEIRGFLRESQNRDERIDLLVVDYLQQLESEGKRETRNQEVGSLSRSLKRLAMEFRIPVLAVSQLKRIAGREPELDDLRDSGEIEQDADTVLFLFGDRAEEHVKFSTRVLKCAKQREGPLFRKELIFDGELVTYRKTGHLTGVQSHGGHYDPAN